MSDFVHLIGADVVQSAAHCMQDTAVSMVRAANVIEESLERHRRWMDDWLQRLETILKEKRDESD
jgi:hypothetical protein